jgi:CheY-like chemotaxis protein
MFSVKWVSHHSQRDPIKIEFNVHSDLDKVVSSCIERLPSMRLSHAQTPPDGFLVFDSAQKEVRRWFASARFKGLGGSRAPAQEPAAAGALEHLEQHGARRILVIDDDNSVRKAIELSLHRQGCVVVLAASGHFGLAAFATAKFDVVMVDIFMPDMEGLEVIKSLRERVPTIPIIAMSGYRFRNVTSAAPDFLDMAVKLGTTTCLRKPFGPRQLMAAIDACAPKKVPHAA